MPPARLVAGSGALARPGGAEEQEQGAGRKKVKSPMRRDASL